MHDASVLARLDAVTVRLGRRDVLRRVSLAVSAGEHLLLVGPNGAGKSTLLRVWLGIARPSAGMAWLGDSRVEALDARERAGRVAWLPQESARAEGLTATDAVSAARFRFGESRASRERATLAALDRVGLSGYAHRPLTALSGGERQKVGLAALLAQEAPLLLLDEPVAHLDPAQRLEVEQLLSTLRGEGRALVVVSHDVTDLGRTGASRVVGLREGAVDFVLAPDSPELPAALGALYGVRWSVARAEDGRAAWLPSLGGERRRGTDDA